MVNTSMEFKHPKYYKELRSIRNKLDQAISEEAVLPSVRPGPGLKPQASSSKPQAIEIQAASDKHQAPSSKPQASSREPQAAQSHYPHKVSSS